MLVDFDRYENGYYIFEDAFGLAPRLHNLPAETVAAV
jgi:hypothetical protein